MYSLWNLKYLLTEVYDASLYLKKDQQIKVESFGLHFIILLQHNAANYQHIQSPMNLFPCTPGKFQSENTFDQHTTRVNLRFLLFFSTRENQL